MVRVREEAKSVMVDRLLRTPSALARGCAAHSFLASSPLLALKLLCLIQRLILDQYYVFFTMIVRTSAFSGLWPKPAAFRSGYLPSTAPTIVGGKFEAVDVLWVSTGFFV